MPRFLAQLLLMYNDKIVKYFWPLSGCRRKEARDSTPCVTQPDSPFTHFVRWILSVMVKVDGFASEVVVKHCVASAVGHVEPIREKLVVNILNRLLQGDDVPLACDLLLDGPVVDT